jgi:hypothetical protein
MPSQNDFVKAFDKLQNNSCFGMTMHTYWQKGETDYYRARTSV